MMSFNWSTLATLGILAAVLHWVIARAGITRWFWDAAWLPRGFKSLLECPACSGFWLGLGLGISGCRPLATGQVWIDVLVAGAASVWCVPVVEGVLLWGLDRSTFH